MTGVVHLLIDFQFHKIYNLPPKLTVEFVSVSESFLDPLWPHPKISAAIDEAALEF